MISICFPAYNATIETTAYARNLARDAVNKAGEVGRP